MKCYQIRWVAAHDKTKAVGLSFFAHPADAYLFVVGFTGYPSEDRKRFFEEHFGDPMEMQTGLSGILLTPVYIPDSLMHNHFSEGLTTPQHRGRKLVGKKYSIDTPRDIVEPLVWMDLLQIAPIKDQVPIEIDLEGKPLAAGTTPEVLTGPRPVHSKPPQRKGAPAVPGQH